MVFTILTSCLGGFHHPGLQAAPSRLQASPGLPRRPQASPAPQVSRLPPSTPPRASLGVPFRALGRGSYSCLSSWRILGSNSLLSVPDLVLLAVPTGFQGASWRQIPPWQCPIGRSWLCRLASKAHLGLKRPLCCHTLASKRRRLRHLRPTCQQRRQRYRAFCLRAAFLSAAVVRSTMNKI